jgi:glutamine amidotransferase-like uncharacterized protein
VYTGGVMKELTSLILDPGSRELSLIKPIYIPKFAPPTVAMFLRHPYASKECVNGMIIALSPQYKIKIFDEKECNTQSLKGIDMVAFPGGTGDATRGYDGFFRRRQANAISDYIEDGGRYLGICMGAYWAGSHYFDILKGVEPVQYIRRPRSEIKRSYETVAEVTWKDQDETMYFYDGCAFAGDESKFKTIARYANGDPMAIIQNNIGLIGCHPESQKSWYSKKNYLKPYWHNTHHHKLLRLFVKELFNR